MGLIISEGTQPSDDGQGYLWSPGIYTEKHIEGWKKVTDAVRSQMAQLLDDDVVYCQGATYDRHALIGYT